MHVQIGPDQIHCAATDLPSPSCVASSPPHTPRIRFSLPSPPPASLPSLLSHSQRRTVTGPLGPNDVVVDKTQLEAIIGSAVIKTDAQVTADIEHAAQVKADRMKEAGARKARMKELEKRAIAMSKKSDSEIEAEGQREAKLLLAKEQMDKNSDTVKLLNSMAARAVAFSIRDQQLQEKEHREEIDREIDRRLDIVMEVDRVQDIQRREEIEREKLIKRKQDGKIITEQMEHNRHAKLLQAEARAQEAANMVKTFKKYAEDDEIKAKERDIERVKSRKAVMLANEASIQAKHAAKEAAVKEMNDILAYQAQRDAEIARREAVMEEEARLKKEREMKLLAQQERAQNNAGKLDELRARRAAEEAERKARKAEKDKAAKQRAEVLDLLASRAKQAENKVLLQHRSKLEEKESVRQGLLYMQKMAQREQDDADKKRRMGDEHRTKLHEQIETRSKVHSDGQGDKFAEGRKFQADIIREEAKLKVIRDKMVNDLIGQGVNPRYLSEMQNVNIGKILKR